MFSVRVNPLNYTVPPLRHMTLYGRFHDYPAAARATRGFVEEDEAACTRWLQIAAAGGVQDAVQHLTRAGIALSPPIRPCTAIVVAHPQPPAFSA